MEVVVFLLVLIVVLLVFPFTRGLLGALFIGLIALIILPFYALFKTKEKNTGEGKFFQGNPGEVWAFICIVGIAVMCAGAIAVAISQT